MTQAKKLLLLLTCLALGQVLMAQTYTSIADGDWTSSSTWSDGVVPLNPVPATATVNIDHQVTISSPTSITNDGVILVRNENAALTVASGGTINNNNEITVESFMSPSFYVGIRVDGAMNNTGVITITVGPGGFPNISRAYIGNLNNMAGGVFDSQDRLGFRTVTNAQGATIKTAEATQTQFLGSFVNNGLFELKGVAGFQIPGSMTNNATGVIDIPGNLANGTAGNLAIIRATVDNLGTINIGPGFASIGNNVGGVLKSTVGQINFIGGNASIDSQSGGVNEWNASSLNGDGKFMGGNLFAGSPANPNSRGGTALVTGTLVASSTIAATIRGTSAEEFSVIEVTGPADISASTLEVGIPNNGSPLYTPTLGDEFEIITATGGVNGTFATTDLPDLGAELDWEVIYESNRVLLRIIAAGGGGGGGGDPGSDMTSVPTMSQWGLILFALLILTLGTITAMQREMSTEGTQNSSFSIKHFPFEKSSFIFWLIGTALALMLVFIVAILFAGYELTNADIPGSLLAIPIAAYLLHLLFGYKK